MPYVTSFERLAKEEGIQEGREEGLKEGIRVALTLKFAKQSDQLMSEIDAIEDIAALERVLKAIPTADTAGQLRSVWV
jgi:flagellar biosynthesis/type III secretory pathway protein FliH